MAPPAAIDPRTVYTVGEVATALRVSDETVRRKINSGELKALEVSSGTRKRYRILLSELVRWLGVDVVRELFGVGQALESFRDLFSDMSEKEREALLERAVTWAKDRVPDRELTGRSATSEEIKKRFG